MFVAEHRGFSCSMAHAERSRKMRCETPGAGERRTGSSEGHIALLKSELRRMAIIWHVFLLKLRLRLHCAVSFNHEAVPVYLIFPPFTTRALTFN